MSPPLTPHTLRANLKIVRELGDHQAQGRAVGNLGNTYYLLGNYKKAVKYHEEVGELGRTVILLWLIGLPSLLCSSATLASRGLA